MILRRQQMRVIALTFLLLIPAVALVSAKSETFKTASSGLRSLLQKRTSSELSTAHRRVQSNFTDSNSNNTSASYLKCYNLLDEVSQTNSTMNQVEYLQFLKLLTDGKVSFNRFQDLPLVFVMIFYTAACTTPDDCMTGSDPVVPVNNTGIPSDTTQLFCKQILKSTTTTAVAQFEYTIRYDPAKIQENTLAVCLSKATVNVLLEELAGCPPLTSSRRLESEPAGEALFKSRLRVPYNAEKRQRKLQNLGSASTPDNSTCPYSISASVETITEFRK